jgi:hypothetical protein
MNRLHPLTEARDQLLNGKPELGVFASMEAVESESAGRAAPATWSTALS